MPPPPPDCMTQMLPEDFLLQLSGRWEPDCGPDWVQQQQQQQPELCLSCRAAARWSTPLKSHPHCATGRKNEKGRADQRIGVAVGLCLSVGHHIWTPHVTERQQQPSEEIGFVMKTQVLITYIWEILRVNKVYISCGAKRYYEIHEHSAIQLRKKKC